MQVPDSRVSLPRIGSYTVVSCWQDECVHRVPVHTEQQDTLLQETALVGTGREPGMPLPSGVARLKYESPGPGAQPEEQGKEDRAAWEEGKTGRHRTWGLFSSVYRSFLLVTVRSTSRARTLSWFGLSRFNSRFLFMLIFCSPLLQYLMRSLN